MTDQKTKENLENQKKKSFSKLPTPFCSTFWFRFERKFWNLLSHFVRSLNRCESERVFVLLLGRPGLFELKKMSQTDGCPCAFRLSDPDEKRGLLFHEFWQQSLTTKDVTHISQPSNLCMNECFVLVFWQIQNPNRFKNPLGI